MRQRIRKLEFSQLLLFVGSGIFVVCLFAALQFTVVLGIAITRMHFVVPALVGTLVGLSLWFGYHRLVRREAELNRFFELSTDMLCIASTNGKLLRLNPAFETILGWPLKTMLQRQLTDFVHPEDVEATMADIEKLTSETSAIRFENRVCCSDGNYRWLVWTAHKTDDGLFYAVAHDVTQHKDMVESLSNSSKRLSAIVDTAVDGIITIDERGCIETVNPATESIFGYEASEMIGENVRILMPSPFQEEHDGYLDNYITTGKRKIIGIGRQVQGLRKDGTIFPLELAVAESHLDERRMFTGIVRDVSERVEQEEKLRQSEARTRALVEVIPDAIMRVDRDGITLDVQAPTTYDSLSSVEGMIGKRQDEFLPEPLASIAMGAITKALNNNELQVIEYEVPTEEQTHIREARVIPSDTDEVLIMIRDITEKKLTEQAKQAAINAERDRIARDLHDSVTQTLFSASIIADVLPILWEKNPDNARTRLDELRELARGALAEMRTLLLELRPAVMLEADLEELLQQLVDALIGRARVRGELSIDGRLDKLPEDVHVAVYRSVQEALNNIAKHADASIVKVHVHRRRDDLTISVRDDGCGFDVTAPKGGHFGLQHIHERIESVGGTVHIESNPDDGTHVQLKLVNLS